MPGWAILVYHEWDLGNAQKKIRTIDDLQEISNKHLEVAHSTSTDSFLKELQRFMNRQEVSSIIYCDIG